MSIPTIFWLILTVAFVVVEVATTGLVSIWFAVGSGVTAIVMAIVNGNGGDLAIGWRITIFVLTSAIALLSTRKFAKKFLKSVKNQETNLELIVNKQAVVTEKIDNIVETGAVKINGLEWSARSKNDEVIEKGEIVLIEQINGNKTIVTRKGK